MGRRFESCREYKLKLIRQCDILKRLMRMPNRGGIGDAHPMNIEEFTHENFNLSEKGFVVAFNPLRNPELITRLRP